jgi:hypothetical protein
MSLHDPFGHLKQKLWPNERSRVKLTIWLSTIKSRESTQIPCFQVACNIPSESSQQRLKLCFKSHLNRKSSHKVMGPQSHISPNFRNFGTPIWKSHDTNVICLFILFIHKYYMSICVVYIWKSYTEFLCLINAQHSCLNNTNLWNNKFHTNLEQTHKTCKFVMYIKVT